MGIFTSTLLPVSVVVTNHRQTFVDFRKKKFFNFSKKNKKQKMKLTTLMPMVVLGAKVPRDSPVRKILKLRRFANEWLINQFGRDSKVHKHWYKKVSQNVNRFKKRYENCGNTEVEYVAKVMADHAASLKEKEEQQVRRRRAKGG